jgi:hypothetical protein
MLLQDDQTRIGYAEGTSEEEAIRSHLQDVLPKSLYNTLATAKQDSKEFKNARSEAIVDFGMDADTIQTAIDALRNTREPYRLGKIVKEGKKLIDNKLQYNKFKKAYEDQKARIADEEGGFDKAFATAREITRPVTPEEAKMLYDASMNGKLNLGGREGSIDRVWEYELRMVAAGDKPQALNSFWIGKADSPYIDKDINEVLEMSLSQASKTKKYSGGLLEREQYRLGELVKQGVKKLTKSADDVIERKPRPEEPTTFADKIRDREEDLDDLVREYQYVKEEFDSLRRAGVEIGDKRYDELIDDLSEIKSDFKTIQSQLKDLGVSPSKKNIEERINKVPMAEGGETPEKKSLLQDDSVMIAIGMPTPTHTMPDGTVMPGTEHDESKMESDEVMEDNYIDFILDEALSEEEEDMLMSKLEQDEELSMLFDKVIEVASEFAGSGPVEGPGTGVSDSIPARLSDGEFVFTAKAVEEIGADNLMAMMKEAEMKADERQGMQEGGIVDEEQQPKPVTMVAEQAPIQQDIRVTKQTVGSQAAMQEEQDLIGEEIKKGMLSSRPYVRS